MPQNRTARRPTNAAAQPQRAVVTFDAKAAGERIVDLVESRRAQIAGLLAVDEGTPLGKRMLDRFVTVALDAIVSDSRTLQADPLSLISSIRVAAQLGLEPSGVLGDGVIVARRDRSRGGILVARFEPMYRGLAKLARRSPAVASLDWQIVFEKDLFRVLLGSEPRIEHERHLDGDPGAIRGAYCYARLTSGELVPTYMSTAQILRVRDKASRSWQDDGEASIWGQWPEPMHLKTVVKAGMKKLPLEPIAQEALAYDDRIDAPIEQPRVSRPAAKGLRAALGIEQLEPGASDASQDVDDAEVAASVTPAENAAPEASTAATGATEPVVASAVCGNVSTEPVTEGETCALEPEHANLRHKNSDRSASWPVVKTS